MHHINALLKEINRLLSKGMLNLKVIIAKKVRYSKLTQYPYSYQLTRITAVFSIKNHCQCYKKVATKSWPVLYTLLRGWCYIR